MEWLKLVLEAASAVGLYIIQSIERGDDAAKMLERPLSEILPHELRTTLVKKAADLAAAKKFGGTE